MGSVASRDANRVTVLMGVNDVTGLPQEILVNDDGEILVSVAGVGTVTSVSVVSANGFAGTVATATSTPAITLTTTINSPILAGNGTAISAATTTGSGSTAVLATSPTLTTPVLNGTITGTGVSQSSSSLTLAQRDGNSNVFANNFVTGYATTVSSGGTTALTVGSARLQFLTGASAHTFTLPNATTLSQGSTFEFNNNSTGAMTVNDNSGGLVSTIPAGGRGQIVVTNTGSAAGTWDKHYLIPTVSSWGTSGITLSGTINKVTITAPATGSTLTIADGKTLTANNSIALSGTDSTTMTFPSTSATIARTDAGQTFTGVQSMTSPDITTSITTPSASFSIANATATTVNFAGAATTLNMGGGSGCAINLGGGANAAELRFLEPSGSGTNYTAFKAQAQAGNVTYTLPSADGAASSVLTTNGSGTLSWASAAGGNLAQVFSSAGSGMMNSIIRWDDASITKTSSGSGSATSSNSMVYVLTSGNADTRFTVAIDSTGAFMSTPTWTSDIVFSGYVATELTANQDIFFGVGSTGGPCTAAGGVANDHTSVARHFGFYIDDATLYASNADGTNQTVTDISAGITLTDMNAYRAVKTTSDIKFYVNETLVATHSTRIPTGTSTIYQVQAGIESRTTTTTNVFLSKSFVYGFERQ